MLVTYCVQNINLRYQRFVPLVKTLDMTRIVLIMHLGIH